MSAKEVESTPDTCDDGSVSLAQGRSRRQRIDKKGRLSAFEKLRQAKEKGIKNKYEIQEEQNVYDVVEEEEYSDLVRQRQEDDWIVDDDGGYVEDGREIFDDEMDESAPVRPGQKKAEGKKKNKNIVRPGTKPKQDIKTMFAAASVSSKRKPEKEVSLAGDDILDSLMGELSKAPSSGAKEAVSGSLGKSSKILRKPAYNPFQVDKALPVPSAKPLTSAPAVKLSKRELSFSQEKAEKRKKSVPNSEEWTKVKVKEEVMDDVPEPVTPAEEVSVKIEQDDQADSADLSGIDFEDDDQDFPQHEEVHVVKTEVEESKAPMISEELLSVGWENVGAADGQSSSATASSDVQVDSSQLPLVTDSAGEQVLRFYWLDAFEDPFRHPGPSPKVTQSKAEQNKLKCKAFRERMKHDHKLNEAFKNTEAERKRVFRAGRTEDQREKERLQSRQRSKAYRERKKATPNKKSQTATREGVKRQEELRERNRLAQQKRRMNMSRHKQTSERTRNTERMQEFRRNKEPSDRGVCST